MRLDILQNKDIFYRQNVALKKYNTFLIKSIARHFYIVNTINALAILKKYFDDNGIEYIVLGCGSNILFVNKYINKNIIYTGLLDSIKISGNTIVAQSGAHINKLVEAAYQNALTGIEFLSYLPASIGGAVYMNARCYGSEMSNIIQSVGIIDGDNNYTEIDNKGCLFEYKKSVFQNNKYIIVNATFNLKKIDMPNIKNAKAIIKEKMISYKNDRIKKKQFSYPSAGSIFLNDYNTNMIAGKVIDASHMRGTKLGGAMVLPTHANFIVNYKNANGSDVYSLIKKIEKKVFDTTSIRLKNEVHIIE